MMCTAKQIVSFPHQLRTDFCSAMQGRQNISTLAAAQKSLKSAQIFLTVSITSFHFLFLFLSLSLLFPFPFPFSNPSKLNTFGTLFLAGTGPLREKHLQQQQEENQEFLMLRRLPHSLQWWLFVRIFITIPGEGRGIKNSQYQLDCFNKESKS